MGECCENDVKIDQLVERVAKLEVSVESQKSLHEDTRLLLSELKKNMDALSSVLEKQESVLIDAKALLESYNRVRSAWSVLGFMSEGFQKFIKLCAAMFLAITIFRATSSIDIGAVLKVVGG